MKIFEESQTTFKSMILILFDDLVSFFGNSERNKIVDISVELNKMINNYNLAFPGRDIIVHYFSRALINNKG
jgi:hypothetical protein